MKMKNPQCAGKKKGISGMFHMSQKVDYGLFLLTTLMKRGASKTISIHEIADESGISFSFLQKIARELKIAGLVTAERGKLGGYRLAKDPSQISLTDVLKALEGDIALVPCCKSDIDCAREKVCSIGSGMKQMNGEIIDMLSKRTIGDFSI